MPGLVKVISATALLESVESGLITAETLKPSREMEVGVIDWFVVTVVVPVGTTVWSFFFAFGATVAVVSTGK